LIPAPKLTTFPKPNFLPTLYLLIDKGNYAPLAVCMYCNAHVHDHDLLYVMEFVSLPLQGVSSFDGAIEAKFDAANACRLSSNFGRISQRLSQQRRRLNFDTFCLDVPKALPVY
jgi:hypothetical protein